MPGRALLAALLLHAAAAAEPDAPEVLPPWVVVESRLVPDVTPIRASSLVPAEAWSGRAVVTLADAFRPIPGAIMQESFGGFEPPRLSLRGSGVQSAPSSRGVAFLLDELPLGLADGSFNSALIEPRLAAQVEVQRGLDGWRMAPATMGGALDLRSPHPAARTAVSLRGEAGSFGARRGVAAYSSRRDANEFATGMSWSRQDGYRTHSEQARTIALASWARDLSGSAGFRLGLYHGHARYAVPGPLTLAAALSAPRSVSPDVARDQPGRVAELTRLAGTFARRTTSQELELGGSFLRSADDFQQLQPNGTSRSRSDDAAMRLGFAQRFSAAGMPQQFRLTATAERGWRDLRRFRTDSGRRGPEFGHDELHPTTTAVQVEEAVAVVPSTVMTVGVARVTARRDVADQAGSSTNLRLGSGATLPQAGVRWRISPEIALFAAAAGSAEPPTFDDILVVTGTYPALQRRSQPLAIQRATTWELGARGRIAALAWDLALYRAAWRDEILRLADPSGVPRGAVNATPTTHTGIEAAARWIIRAGSPRVSLSTAAAWNDIRFDGDPNYGRGRLAGLPPHVGNAELLVTTTPGLFGAIALDWTHGQTRVDHAGRLAYGGRTLPHARLGWHSATRWTWFVDIRNIFDHASIASTAGVLDLARNPAATSIFLPAPGRSVTVGFEWVR